MFALIKKTIQSPTSKDTLITLLGNIGIVLWGLIFTIIIARTLSPAPFGLFSALIALPVIISSIADFGVANSLINFLPKTHRKRSLISLTFWFQVMVGFICIFVLLLLIPIRQAVVPGSTITQIVLIALLTWVFIINGYFQKLFRAQKKFITLMFIRNFDGAIKILLILLTIYLKALTPQTVIFVTLLSSLLSCLVAFSIKPELFHLPKKFIITSRLVTFSKWSALIEFFGIISIYIDPLLLVALSTKFQAGIFSAGHRVSLFYSLLVTSLAGVIGPRFAKFKTTKQVLSYLSQLSVMISFFAVIMLLSLIAIPSIVETFFGDDYLRSIPVFRALIIAMLPWLFSLLTVTPLIFFFNQPRFIAKISFCQTIIILAVDLILIPRLGALAPPTALLLGNIFLFSATAIRLILILA